MIFVQRLPAPQFFVDYVLRMTGPDGISPKDASAPLRYPDEIRARLKAQLYHEFAGKCAYCESRLYTHSSGDIDEFRPKSRFGIAAMLDWDNLMLACAVCNRNKGDRFPVMSRRNTGALTYGQSLAREKPMLLNPCRDQPDDHLRFTLEGLVHGLTERGQVTIATLDLNRLQLVEARRHSPLDASSTRLDLTALAADNPYTASSAHSQRVLVDEGFRTDVERARILQQQYDDERERVATDKEGGLRDYAEFERYIERVELTNIGIFSSLRLDLLVTEQRRKPCFALLGENGIGKSTILRAVACALAGDDYARKLKLTSNSLLASDSPSGSISVRLTGYRDPVVVTLNRDAPLAYNSDGAKTLVLAYGASRLLAAGRHKAERKKRHAKIRNLFDPFVPVSDASTWLDKLAPERLADVQATLERILNEAPDTQTPIVVADDGMLRFSLAGAEARPVTELSDGYKALIGMAGDIMAVMHAARFDNMQDAMGIVLIDELGNHFHPQLKLRIVGALRAAFPKIQFIYTSHEPLCLRGMEEGEIGVLRRDDDGIYLLTDLPDPATMRVDQLLASEHFGLESTVDPARVADIRRYHQLLRKTDRSADEQTALDELRATLGKTDYLGGSRRERMLLELLDMHDNDPVREPGNKVSAAALSRRTLNRLKDIMRAVEPGMTGRDGIQ